MRTEQDESQEPSPDEEVASPPEGNESTTDDRRSRLRLPGGKRLRTVLAALLALLLVGGAGGYFWAQANTLPEGVAFRIGDRDVSVDELNQRVDTLRALYGVQPPEKGEKLERFRRDAAKSQAVSMVLDEAARERNIAIAGKSARDVLSRYIAQQVGEGPDAHEKFVRILGNAGTSEQDVLDEIKRQLALSRLYDQVTKGGGKVSDAQLREAFGKRRAQLGKPERRELSNIVVRTKQDAEQVLSDLKAGRDFRSVAGQRSLDGSTRDSGGDLGQVRQDQLEGGYGKAAFSAEPGSVFGPVKNKFGWNVGKVRRVLAPVPAEFAQVKGKLKDTLRVEKATRAWRAWLGERIKSAEVEYADRYRPANPTAPPGGAPK